MTCEMMGFVKGKAEMKHFGSLLGPALQKLTSGMVKS